MTCLEGDVQIQKCPTRDSKGAAHEDVKDQHKTHGQTTVYILSMTIFFLIDGEQDI